MAQREQHERVKRMDRWAEKLLGHKAMVVAILVVIAAASGLAMAGFGGHSSDVSFERSDEASASDVRGAGDASPDDADEPSAKSSSSAEVYVDVDGAVVKPGVYRLKDGARVSQAIDAAGGFSEKANQTAWNLAEVLQDGMQVYIPSKDEAKEALNEEQSLGKDLSASQKEDTVNINTASKEELMTLPGIGESRADAVIACREEKGSFTSIEGIKDAAGIGDGIFNRIKDLITVN